MIIPVRKSYQLRHSLMPSVTLRKTLFLMSSVNIERMKEASNETSEASPGLLMRLRQDTDPQHKARQKLHQVTRETSSKSPRIMAYEKTGLKAGTLLSEYKSYLEFCRHSSMSGSKASKNGLSVLVSAVVGDFKLKPIFIYHFEYVRFRKITLNILGLHFETGATKSK